VTPSPPWKAFDVREANRMRDPLEILDKIVDVVLKYKPPKKKKKKKPKK
jgi:hypothetical protein